MIDTRVLPVDQISEGTNRAREDYGDLEKLKDSLADLSIGQIQSLAVFPTNEGYEILAGGRRLRAVKALVEEERHTGEVMVRIYPKELDKKTRLKIELAENENRLDMSWQEQVALTKKIHDLNTEIVEEDLEEEEDWNAKKTAEIIGKHRTGVTREIRLAEAMEVIPELKDCNTKDEAEKLIAKLTEEAIVKKQASKIQERQATTPLEKVRKTIAGLYHIGDAFTGMADLPDNTFDLIEMDPPYASEFEASGLAFNKEQSNILDKLKTKDFNAIAPENFPASLFLMINEAKRLLKPNGWLILWYAQDPWANQVYETIIEAGLKMKRIPAVWSKSHGGEDTRFTASPDNYLGRMHETFYYARKGEAKIIRRARGDVFNYLTPSSSKRIYPTEKPISLLRDILSTFAQPGARILSPFLGSGNSILAAAELGMHCTGFELSEEYYKKFLVRLEGWDPAHPEE